MARAVDPSVMTPVREIVELAAAALDGRGRLSATDAVALLRPLPDALDAARIAAAGAPKLPPRTAAGPRAFAAALGLADRPAGDTGGPAAFRAPELAGGDRPTSRSDVYAVAGLLRTAITGDPPPPWTLDALPAPDGARRLPEPLQRVLWEALADDPARRPVTPGQLLERAAVAAAVPAPSASSSALRASSARARSSHAPKRPAVAWSLPTGLPTGRRAVVGAAAAGALLLGTIAAVTSGGGDPVAPADVAALPVAPASFTAELAYAATMRDAMRGLNLRRIARRQRLAAAADRTSQVREATALGDAYGIAARTVDRAPAPADVREPTAAISEIMRKTESAYRLMARGARDDDRRRYVAGRDAVRRREAILQRRLQRLGDFGYIVL